MTHDAAPVVVVVGIGADGWEGLSAEAQREVAAADVVFGSARQVALVPVDVEKVTWGAPLVPSLEAVLAEHEGRARVVLASGDPLFFGLATPLSARVPVRVVPHLSSAALAFARLGWSWQETAIVSLVGRPLASLSRALHDGARVLVLSADASTPAQVAHTLVEQGFGESSMVVLGDLGAPSESSVSATAATWSAEVPALNLIALTCRGTGRSVAAGLPDDVFENDGQITKREVRAVLLSLLAPQPGQLLWDVGAGTGSVGIEWMRLGGRAVGIEKSAEKGERVTRNADSLGVPGLKVVVGDAPAALADLDVPDAVFVGGGVTAPGLLEQCWHALKPGGRLVANAVTLESEAVLLDWQAKHGGELLRLSVQRTAPVGSFTGWKPMTTLTILSGTK